MKKNKKMKTLNDIKLYPHQQEFYDDNPNKALLAFDTGCGKTFSALLWISKRTKERHLVIVPKNILGKWQKDIAEYLDKKINVEVLTKEQFKKYAPKKGQEATSIIVDEADFFGSQLFSKGRSKLAEALYDYLRSNKIENVLLMTATPLRSAPHTIHTLLTYIGKAPIWKDWRDRCYSLEARPYLQMPAYLPIKKWRKIAVEYAQSRIYTAKLGDIATVPKQYEEVVNIKIPVPTDIVEETAVGEWHAYARAEQGMPKLEWIMEYIKDKSKVVIVCRYKSQIEEYAKELQSIREVFVLTGDTTDQDREIREAKESYECVLLVQASVGAGFQLAEDRTKKGNEKFYNFSHMIFASMSFTHRDWVQMRGRILRADSLQENWYVYLLGGRKDKLVYEKVMSGEDYKI